MDADQVGDTDEGEPREEAAPLDVDRPPASLARYRIETMVGRGGVGVVYAAYDPELDRRVAIKVLQSRVVGGDAEATARLLREAQAIAKISHPNVVAVHDVGTYESPETGAYGVFIVMELVEGLDGDAWLRAEPRSFEDVRRVFVDAGRGLAAAHEAGVVHRDFKPSNVLVARDGRVRVLDFGLARALEVDAEAEPETGRATATGSHGGAAAPVPSDEESAAAAVAGEPPKRATGLADLDTTQVMDSSVPTERISGPVLGTNLTQSGVVVGTPRYMAPEHHMGQDVGPAADQFSFCASLFLAVYRVAAFPGQTLVELATAKADGEVSPPPAGHDVPRWAHDAMLRGLSPDPSRRWPSMVALLDALEPEADAPVQRAAASRSWRGPGALVLALAAAGAAFSLAGPADDASSPSSEVVAASESGEAAAPIPPEEEAAPERHGLAIAPFRERTGDERLDFAPKGLPALLAHELQPLDADFPIFQYFQLEPHRGPSEEADYPASWRAAARTLGASFLVYGETAPDAAGLVLRVWVEDLATGDAEVLERSVAIREAPGAVRKMTRRVAALAGRPDAAFPAPADPEFEYDRWMQLALLELGHNRYRDALGLLEKAEAIHADRGEVHFYRALVDGWLSRPRPEVIAHIDRALALDLTVEQREFMVGFRLQNEARFPEGVEHFSGMQAQRPRSWLAHYGLFECQYHAGWPRRAAKTWEAMVALDPRSSLGSVHVMFYFEAQGDADAIRRTIERTERASGEPDIEWRGRLLHVERRYEDYLDDALRRGLAPDSTPSLGAALVLGRTPLVAELVSDVAVRAARPSVAGVAVPMLTKSPQAEARYEAFAADLRSSARVFASTERWMELLMLGVAIGDRSRTEEELAGLESTLDQPYNRSQYVHVARAIGRAAADGAFTAATRSGPVEGPEPEWIAEAADSPFPAVQAVARAEVARRRGEHASAAEAWTDAFAHDGDGRFALVLSLLAATSHERAGNHQGVVDACHRVVEPTQFRWSFTTAGPACLRMMARAHRARGNEAEASDADARLARLQMR